MNCTSRIDRRWRSWWVSLICLGLGSPLARAQIADTATVWQIMAQAAAADSVEVAKEKYEAAYALADQLNFDRGVLASLDVLIPMEMSSGEATHALRYLLEQLELLEKTGSKERLSAVNKQIGDLYLREGLHEEAVAYYQGATAALAHSYGDVDLLDKLGFCHAQLGQPDSAEVYYNLLAAMPGKNASYQLVYLRKIVAAYQDAGQYETALEHNLRIKSIMENDPGWRQDLGTIYNNLGYTHNFLGRYDQSITWFRQAESFFLADQRKLATLYTNLGVAHFNNGDGEVAIQYLAKALAQVPSRDYAGKGQINNILSNIYLQREDFFNAQNYNRDAIAAAEESGDMELKSQVYATAAEIHSGLFEYEEAIEAYKRHLGLRDSLLRDVQRQQDQLVQDKLEFGRAEREIKLLLIRGEIQDLTIEQLKLERVRQQLEIDNLSLEAQQKASELAILKQTQEIREAKIKNQELENERTRQELLLVQGQLEIQEQQQRLNELAQAEALAQAELERKEAQLVQEEQRIELLEKEQEIQQRSVTAARRIGLLLLVISLMILAGLLYTRRTNKKLGEQKLEIEAEQERSERLLLNILPAPVAQELKDKGTTTPRRFESVSILFSDFVGFTRIAAERTPEQIIAALNECFKGFDAIMETEGVEKIQTVGDGYLAVGGLPDEHPDHALKCVSAARKMITFLEEYNRHSSIQWGVRIGIHSGAITAGVVGTKKFAYNIFGDTVNTASRIETAGAQGRINVSATTYDLIREQVDCEYRGKISAKGKGDLDMYFVK